MKAQAKKIPNFPYVCLSLWRMMLPRVIRRLQRRLLLRGWERRPDAEDIRERVNYYCQYPLGKNDGELEAREITPWRFNSKYVFDLQSFLHGWPGRRRLNFFSGDTIENPDVPTIIKTRRLDSKASLSTLFNMDYRRHFMKVVDPVPFAEKEDVLFFRGAVSHKPHRIRMMEMWADAPFTDFGDTSTDWESPWKRPMVKVTEHFRYRYILCPEGNDVCSSLQWVMASECVPVMTRPTVEGWLMHGKMEAGVHYVEIAPDYSDLQEKMEYYFAHPEEAEAISRNSQVWAERFADRRRERIISHLVLERYFSENSGNSDN